MLLACIPDDVVIDILDHWVIVIDLGRLDNACCSQKHRSYVLRLLSLLTLKDQLQLYEEVIFDWIFRRDIRVNNLVLSDHSVGSYLRIRFPLPRTVNQVTVSIFRPLDDLLEVIANTINARYSHVPLIIEFMSDDSSALLNRIENLYNLVSFLDYGTNCFPIVAERCTQLKELILNCDASEDYSVLIEQILCNNPLLTRVKLSMYCSLPIVEQYCQNIQILEIRLLYGQFTSLQVFSLLSSRPTIKQLEIYSQLFELSYSNVKAVKTLSIDGKQGSKAPIYFWNDLTGRISDLTSAEFVTEINVPNSFFDNNCSTLTNLVIRRSDFYQHTLELILRRCLWIKELTLSFERLFLTQVTEEFVECSPCCIEKLILEFKSAAIASCVIGIIKACRQLIVCEFYVTEMDATNKSEITDFLMYYYRECGHRINCVVYAPRNKIIFRNGVFTTGGAISM